MLNYFEVRKYDKRTKFGKREWIMSLKNVREEVASISLRCGDWETKSRESVVLS